MENILHSESLDNGIVINFYHDDIGINPRKDYDHIGRMICFHRNYRLGDVHSYYDLDSAVLDLWLDHASLSEMREKLMIDLKDIRIVDRLRILKDCYQSTRCEFSKDVFTNFYTEHCSISKHFTLPLKLTWLPLYLYDHSGITMRTTPFSCIWDSGQVGIIYMLDDETMQLEDQLKLLKSEVREYDLFLTGQCYSYIVIDSNENEIDSCGGFLDEFDNVKEQIVEQFKNHKA